MNYNIPNHSNILYRNIHYYISRRKTPTRILCDEYLKKVMIELYGMVIELGGIKRFGYNKFAKNATKYIVTNMEGSHEICDQHADILNLPYEDNSVDNFVAIALLEHVNNPPKALREVQRCLKIGGRVVLIVPAMFPRNPAPEEFFRFSPTSLVMMLEKCKILNIANIGGLITLNSLALQNHYIRPLGIMMYLVDLLFGSLSIDKYPVLIGVLAEKKKG